MNVPPIVPSAARFLRVAPVLPLLLALVIAFVASAGTPGTSDAASPAPPAAPSAPSTTATLRRRLLPTADEWMKQHGRPATVATVEADELPLIEYRAPDVEVLAIDPRAGCPEPRREPTFEVVFDREGNVAAIQSADSVPCPPLAGAWKDAITTWRLRELRINERPVPALIRFTVRSPKPPKPPPVVEPSTRAGEPPATPPPTS